MKNHCLSMVLVTLALLAGVSCQPDKIGETVVPVSSITLSPVRMTLSEGDSRLLEAVIEPENATNKEVIWDLRTEGIVSIAKDGTVTGLKEGFVRITATSADNPMRKAYCSVTVIPAGTPNPDVKVTGVRLDPEALSLTAGETAVLSAIIQPANAGNQKVTWSSENATVASISDNGTLRARTAGETLVTATTAEGGFTASCRVTVSPSGDETPRWTDTGADVPAYPDYNPVFYLADFPRIDITWTHAPYRSGNTFPYVDGTISFRDPKQMYSEVTELTGLKMQIRGRGNTTWNAEGGIKNPYRIKLAEHTKIFGMKGDKDWILLSDVQDPSLLRNAVALRISRLVSMPWTPKYRAAEVYINGQYNGCYLLVEAKEADRENKVPVTVVTENETDGGYYLELDDKTDNDLYFRTSRFGKMIKYKDPENPTAAQKAFIEGYIADVEKLLQNKEFSKETGYWTRMEVSTFIDQYIVQELTMNVDGNMRLSTYFAKDFDTKLFMPFCWDFDLALGNCTYIGQDFNLPYYDGSRNGPKGWFVKIRGGYPGDWSYPYGIRDTYYQYLFMDPQFVEALKARWNEVKPRLDLIPAFIDKMVEYNRVAYDHNASAGKNPRARRGSYYPPDNFTSWSEAVDWMKDFYTTRLAWLDEEINRL